VSAEAHRDRRLTAIAAFQDAIGEPPEDPAAAYARIVMAQRVALEAATQIKITADVVMAFKRHAHPAPLEPNIVPALRAAFEAAGFEVVE
jgi:hypothetical protein